jgi:hypothetical protein
MHWYDSNAILDAERNFTISNCLGGICRLMNDDNVDNVSVEGLWRAISCLKASAPEQVAYNKFQSAAALIEEHLNLAEGKVLVFCASECCKYSFVQFLQSQHVRENFSWIRDHKWRADKEAVRTFQRDDVCVLVTRLEHVAKGIHLTSANLCIFLDLVNDLNTVKQAQHRIHRLGQQRACRTVQILVGETYEYTYYKWMQQNPMGVPSVAQRLGMVTYIPTEAANIVSGVLPSLPDPVDDPVQHSIMREMLAFTAHKVLQNRRARTMDDVKMEEFPTISREKLAQLLHISIGKLEESLVQLLHSKLLLTGANVDILVKSAGDEQAIMLSDIGDALMELAAWRVIVTRAPLIPRPVVARNYTVEPRAPRAPSPPLPAVRRSRKTTINFYEEKNKGPPVMNEKERYLAV